MNIYRVMWETDVEAASPIEAARKAKAELITPTRGVDAEAFQVTDELGNADMVHLDGDVETTWVLTRIRPHHHTFVGDEDTCQYGGGCPVTWHQYQSMKGREGNEDPAKLIPVEKRQARS